LPTIVEKRNRACRITCAGGFTLIELLLVVALLGVLAGVVFPRLKGTVRAAGLDEGSQRLAAVIRYARAESVRRGLKVRLTLDSVKNAYTMSLQNAEAVGGEDFASFEDELLDAEHRLPQGVRIKQIIQGEQRIKKTVLIFEPSGVSAPYAIELTDDAGRVDAVEIGPWLDEVSVVQKKTAT